LLNYQLSKKFKIIGKKINFTTPKFHHFFTFVSNV
jgi:hypothetical protein